MSAIAKEQDAKNKPQATQPAKGGTEKADDKVHQSEDSPKPHGDPLNHVIKKN